MDLADFRYYTEWNHVANRRRYGAPADPWTQIRVDPAEVEYFTVVELTWGLGRVRGGDWDRPEQCRRPSDSRMVEGLRERFEDGLEWEATVYYEWASDRIEDDGHVRGYEDVGTFVEERCAAVDDLYESIREDGYRPNHGTRYDDPGEIERVHEMDPMVLIGRSGEVIWTEGFHRLILAQILGIDRIPVYVLRRHEQWQRVRDEIAGTPVPELPAELQSHVAHPDADDLSASTDR